MAMRKSGNWCGGAAAEAAGLEPVVVVGGAVVAGAAFVGFWPEPPQPAASAARRGSTATSAVFVRRTRPVGSTRGAKSSCRAADTRGAEPDERAGRGADIRWFGFLDDLVDATRPVA